MDPRNSFGAGAIMAPALFFSALSRAGKAPPRAGLFPPLPFFRRDCALALRAGAAPPGAAIASADPGMIFRLFRLPILLGLAFLAGIVYERDRVAQECQANPDLLAERLC